MRAAVYRRYGAPEVVPIEDVPKPVPKDDEALIRIHATTVAAADWRLRRAASVLIRLMNGFWRPTKTLTLGMEFAGTVESVGKAVTRFRAGDEVFGSNGFRFGAHAEYLCVCESGMLAVKPAKHFGATVTAVCSTAHLELVRSLGADAVATTRNEDFSKAGRVCDIVFDAVRIQRLPPQPAVDVTDRITPGGSRACPAGRMHGWAPRPDVGPLRALSGTKSPKRPARALRTGHPPCFTYSPGEAANEPADAREKGMNADIDRSGTDQERPPLSRQSLLTAAGLALALLASPATSAAQGGRWTPTSLEGAPEGRWNHVAVWTGSKMIVWGGYSETDFPVTGFLYDPTANTWAPMSTPPELQYCDTCAAVWTGSRMITWGTNWDWVPVGQVYEPAADSWTFITANGAPTARVAHTSTWTGSKMLAWGGWDNVNTGLPQTNTGGIYDPSTDLWSPTSLVDAPTPREGHTAVWTGSKMIVWGGYRREGGTGILTNTGGVYDPATDTWTPMSTIGAPTARDSHTAVWTGSKMIVWGGYDGVAGVPSGTGGIYDPKTDAWTPTSTVGAPSGRSDHTAVWTGSKMIVWGGWPGGSAAEDTGGIYDPATDTWTPTSLGGAPSERSDHTAVWTGWKMIVWGGTGATGACLDSGGVFAPPGGPGFYTVSPCRVLDSRQATGPWAGQPLGAGQERALSVVGGACGIPATATALSFNITVTSATATGYLRVYPAGVARPPTSTLNFVTGLTRANNGIVALGAAGDLSIHSGQASGSVHVILDVSGYFE